MIAVDLKGFGRSDKPFDERYSIIDQAALVAEFMQRMELRDVTVVGHSFGGGVALMLALDNRPEMRKRVKRLVLLDSIAYPQKMPSFFKVLRTPVLGHLGATATPPELQAKAALMLAYHDDSRIKARDVAAYSRPLYTPGGKNALVRSVQQIVPANLPSIARRYTTIRKPVLHHLVQARQDRTHRPRLAPARRSAKLRVPDHRRLRPHPRRKSAPRKRPASCRSFFIADVIAVGWVERSETHQPVSICTE